MTPAQKAKDALENNPERRRRIKAMVESEDFKALIRYCETKKGKYSDTFPEAKEPHIQDERNGGNKGWNKLRHLLMNAHEIAGRKDSEDDTEATTPKYVDPFDHA